MGICASCLGLNRDRDLAEDDETSRLLFDEAHGNHYGSFGEQSAGTFQADPQELQRETEALQKVVALTSNHLVDILAMVPQTTPPASITTFPTRNATLLHYQDVLAKLSTKIENDTTEHTVSRITSSFSDGWISDDELEERTYNKTDVKFDSVGPLIGGFADADAAMS